MAEDEVLQRAVNDLAMVRRAVERAQVERGQVSERSAQVTRDANLMLHIIALATVLGLLAFEAVTHELSTALLWSAAEPQLRRLEVLQIGASLPIFLGFFYFVVWRAVRRSDEGWSAYVARNFQYLRNLTFVADLFVKFVVLALLMEARHPQWVAPLLTLFVGDYLLQGRFFVLPVRVAFALGVVTVALAAVQFQAGASSLVGSFAVFGAVTATSLGYLVLLGRRGGAPVAEAAE